MGINCIICGDCFVHNSEVVVNSCGHAFHDVCLYQWLERSKTCPHCRSSTTKRTIQKVFFNFANTDNDDAGMMRTKLDDAVLELRMEKSKLNKIQEDFDLKEAQNIALRDNNSKLEKQIRSLGVALSSIKEDLEYYREKGKVVDSLRCQISTLNDEITRLKYVETALHGSSDGMYEILQNEKDISKIALLTSTLKKALIKEEKAKNEIKTQLNSQAQILDKYRKRYRAMKCENSELKKNLSTFKSEWDEEKQILKQKIEELNNKQNDSMVQRILTESPAPLPRQKEMRNDNVPSALSKSPSELVVDSIVVSDSPYLPVKSNYSSIFNGNVKYSAAFLKPKTLLKCPEGALKRVHPQSSTVNNGLGGREREDVWKFSEKTIALKKHKSTSSLPSAKYKKLTANPSNRKITEYVLIEDE